MAIGDFFTNFSGANSSLSIQPAAGVVLCATSLGNNLSAGAGGGEGIRITDGANDVQFTNGSSSTRPGQTYLNMKIFANNTNYLLVNANGAGQHTSVTGIEVQ